MVQLVACGKAPWRIVRYLTCAVYAPQKSVLIACLIALGRNIVAMFRLVRRRIARNRSVFGGTNAEQAAKFEIPVGYVIPHRNQ
jgi:hypothetical protein